MRLCLALFGALFAWLLVQPQAQAQIRYRVGLDADKVTYRVYMTSAVSYTGTQAIISTAQVTLVVPHGTGANQFKVTNQVNKTVDSEELRFSLNSRANAPCVDPTRIGGGGAGYAPCTTTVGGSSFVGVTYPFDYLSFGYSGSSSNIRFDIPANVEIELFSFKNSGPCLGEVALFDNVNDPFRRSNSANSNPGNQITVLGAGRNVYQSNYGTTADCRTPAPDLTAAINGPATVSAGVPTAFSVSVTNVGLLATTGTISVTTVLPAGLGYTSSTGAGWACMPSVGTGGTTPVVCSSTASLSVNGSSTFALTVTPTPSLGTGTSLSIAGSVGGGGETNTANNGFSTTVTGQGQAGTADLSAVLGGPASLTVGNPAAYSLSLTNGGAAASSGTVLASTVLPTGLLFVSSTGAGWSCSSTNQTNGTTLVACLYNAAVAAGASAPVLGLTVLPNQSLAGTTVAISGSISGGSDANLTNNNYSRSATVQAAPATDAADLSASLSGPASLSSGETGAYVLTVNNNGPAATSGVTSTTTTLPAGLSLAGFSGAGWSCSALAPVGGNTPIVCTTNALIAASGSFPLLTLRATATNASAADVTVNVTGTIRGTGETNLTNNSYSTPTIITGAQARPDLTVTIGGPVSIPAGSASVYSVTATNVGTAPTTGPVTLTATLPAGLVLTGTAGTGWVCTPTVQANQTTLLNCTYADLLPAQTAAPALKLTVTPNSSLVGTAVSLPVSIGTPGDTNPANNTALTTANVTTATTQQADLSTSVLVDNRTPTPGSSVTVRVVVTNAGPDPAAAIMTQVTLPAGASVLSTSMTGGMFDPTTGRWSVGTLTAGQSVTLTVGLQATESGISYITSEVMASSVPDPNSAPGNGDEFEDDFSRNCFSLPALLCAGDAFVVSVPASASTVQWFRNGQPIQGATGLSLTVTDSGTYTVETTGQKCPAEGCCPLLVQVEPLPVLTFGPGSLTGCGSYDLRLVPVLANGQAAPLTNLTYHMNRNDAFAGLNPTLPVVSATGVYWIRYQSASGCYEVIGVSVTITTRPATPTLTLTTLTNTCPATTVNLTAAQPAQPSTVGGVFEWRTGSGNTAPVVVNASAAPAGTYYLFERNGSGCYNSVPSVPVTVTITTCCKPDICVPVVINRRVRTK